MGFIIDPVCQRCFKDLSLHQSPCMVSKDGTLHFYDDAEHWGEKDAAYVSLEHRNGCQGFYEPGNAEVLLKNVLQYHIKRGPTEDHSDPFMECQKPLCIKAREMALQEASGKPTGIQ